MFADYVAKVADLLAHGNPIEFQDTLMSVASLNREHNSIEPQ